MRRFITKKIQRRPCKFINKTYEVNEVKIEQNPQIEEVVEVIALSDDKVENNDTKEENDMNVMDTKEKIEIANQILNMEQSKVKRVKKDKGLIERVESSKTILTEDNRELLRD